MNRVEEGFDDFIRTLKDDGLPTTPAQQQLMRIGHINGVVTALEHVTAIMNGEGDGESKLQRLVAIYDECMLSIDDSLKILRSIKTSEEDMALVQQFVDRHAGADDAG